MARYRFDVWCRQSGALGDFERRYVEGAGDTVDAALLSLYDHWEHIRVIDCMQLPETAPRASDSAGGPSA